VTAAPRRLLLVSNRLPVTLASADGEPRIMPSVGGLATGLRGPHERSSGMWIGWPGMTDPVDARHRTEVAELLAAHGTAPVWLTADEVSRYYEQVSNGVLWPLFHYLVEHVPLRVEHWDTYEAVNARFADVVAAHYRPGDLVWVHDYQLLRVPALLRARCPGARIGFFLHIPFPCAEVFAALPARAAVLEGLLGADVVGFHTAGYAHHFADSVRRVLGLEATADGVIRVGDRVVRTGVFPMGVDAAGYEARAHTPAVDHELAALAPIGEGPRDGPGEVALFVGIDRLDYTKGIPRRLLAFEQLLLRHPALRERVRLVQVAVPSRTAVPAYAEFRTQVDALVGRINGAFGTPRWTPVHYLYRALSDAQLLALYRAARVMLVTPVRDGMNLVAKEFVASRRDEDGVLVLSEFVGAADELTDALRVNPYDVDASAEAYHAALVMPREERRRRMRALRDRVRTYDVDAWAAAFMQALADESGARAAPATWTGLARARERAGGPAGPARRPAPRAARYAGAAGGVAREADARPRLRLARAARARVHARAPAGARAGRHGHLGRLPRRLRAAPGARPRSRRVPARQLAGRGIARAAGAARVPGGAPGALVRVVRAARAGRVLAGATRGARLVRVVASVNRGMKALGRSFARRGLGYLVALTLLVTVGGAAGMYAFERDAVGGAGLAS
jgi:trehalose 6-phosphate synthase/phosphatase